MTLRSRDSHANNQPSPNEPDAPAAWQPRFGIRGMLLLMLVVSVMAAGGYYLAQALRGSRPYQFAFILFTLASPLLVMVFVSLTRAILDRPSRPR